MRRGARIYPQHAMRKPKAKSASKSCSPAARAKSNGVHAPPSSMPASGREVVRPEFSEVKRGGVGRPNETYTPEAAKTICDRVGAGWSVRQACYDMPFDRVTVYRWARTIPEFRTAFAHARELNLDGMADDMVSIADDGTNDWYLFESASGKQFVKLNDEAVRRSQLRLEARYRILGAMRAAQWGKRLDVTSGGEKLDSLAAALLAVGKAADESVDGAVSETPSVAAH